MIDDDLAVIEPILMDPIMNENDLSDYDLDHYMIENETVIFSSSDLVVTLDHDRLCMYLDTDNYHVTVYKTRSVFHKKDRSVPTQAIDISDTIFNINLQTIDNLDGKKVVSTIERIVNNLVFT